MNEITENFIDEIAQDAAPAEVSAVSLAEMIDTAERMRSEEAEVARLTAELKEAAAKLQKTQTEDLPTMMLASRMLAFKLLDGGSMELRPDLHCAITEANKPLAFKWLETTGNGGIIKTAVVTEFDRDEHEKANEFIEKAQKLIPDRLVELKQGVHAQTLKAFVKEQRAKPGNKFPDELFSVHPFNKAVYVPPPKKRARKG